MFKQWKVPYTTIKWLIFLLVKLSNDVTQLEIFVNRVNIYFYGFFKIWVQIKLNARLHKGRISSGDLCN